jgi:hypothetical protein
MAKVTCSGCGVRDGASNAGAPGPYSEMRSAADTALAEAMSTLRALVDKLPKCACGAAATRAAQRGGARYCDAHGAGVREYPRAAPLRIALALLRLFENGETVPAPCPDPSDDGPALSFRYRNHRGEVAERRVRPIHVWYGSTEHHPYAQWLLRAYDLDKQAERDFALHDVLTWGALLAAAAQQAADDAGARR